MLLKPYRICSGLSLSFQLFVLLLVLETPACAKKEVELDQLQERNNIFYEINSEKAFSGIAFERYDNGQMRDKGEVVEGKREGEWHTWKENGVKYGMIKFDKGEITYFIGFHDNGTKSLETDIKNHALTGTTIGYDENGSRLFELKWKNKIPQSYKSFSSSGKLEITASFNGQGELDGQVISMGQGDKSNTLCHYENGFLVRYDIDMNNTKYVGKYQYVDKKPVLMIGSYYANKKNHIIGWDRIGNDGKPEQVIVDSKNRVLQKNAGVKAAIGLLGRNCTLLKDHVEGVVKVYKKVRI